MRHHGGLAARPPLRYTLRVARGGCSPFSAFLHLRSSSSPSRGALRRGMRSACHLSPGLTAPHRTAPHRATA
ncbi:hypothetical protein ATKI12_2994 [Kitasatospora sp. Ki12]